MNRQILELRHPRKDGEGKFLLPLEVSKDHKKRTVEDFLDRLGIPHMKDDVQIELPFKQVQIPQPKHRHWLYGIVGIALGIGISMSWIKWLNSPKPAAYSMSSFIAEYEWDGFRRVMPTFHYGSGR